MPSAQDILDTINAAKDRLGDVTATSGGVSGRLEDVKGRLGTVNGTDDLQPRAHFEEYLQHSERYRRFTPRPS